MREIYSPISVYNIKFDEIKSNILKAYPDGEDYGSIIVIRCEACRCTFYILRNGTIQIIGSDCESSNHTKEEIIGKLQSIFLEQIDDMRYNYFYPVF